jgi:RNA polymerase sigma-70 factor (ECF subfamily)
MAPRDDRQLAELALAGDANAYGELVERYQNAVMGVCVRVLGDRAGAEDAAQEVFLRAHRKLATFDRTRPFGPWVKRVAVNFCLNLLAARPAEVALYDEHDHAPDDTPLADPVQQLLAAERARMIQAAIAALPQHQRAVIELRHYHDLSYDVIAAELGRSLSDVKSDLFRARRALAERLRGYLES